MASEQVATAPAERLERARAVLERLQRDVAAEGRQDLARELGSHLGERPGDALWVVLCGETNRGKSTLVGALLDRPGLLPARRDSATDVYIVVRAPREGESERVIVHRAGGDEVTLALDDDLAPWVTRPAGGDVAAPQHREVGSVEVVLRHPLLERGLALVDTPGVGGLDRAHGEAMRSALTMADAVVLVSSAGTPVSGVEMQTLDEALGRVALAAVAVNGSDQAGAGVVAEESRQRLRERFGDRAPTVVLTSARNKAEADLTRAEDPEFADELTEASGVPELRMLLERFGTDRVDDVRAVNLCGAARAVLTQVIAHEEAVAKASALGDDDLDEQIAELARRVSTLQGFSRAETGTLREELGFVRQRVDAELRKRALDLKRSWQDRITAKEVDDFEASLEADLYRFQNEMYALVEGEIARIAELAGQQAAAQGVPLRFGAIRPEEVAVQVAEAPEEAKGWALQLGGLVPRAGMLVAAAVIGSPVMLAVGAAAIAAPELMRRGAETRRRQTTQSRESIDRLVLELGPALGRMAQTAGRDLVKRFEQAVAREVAEAKERQRALEQQRSRAQAERAAASTRSEQRMADLRGRLETADGIAREALGALGMGTAAGDAAG